MLAVIISFDVLFVVIGAVDKDSDRFGAIIGLIIGVCLDDGFIAVVDRLLCSIGLREVLFMDSL
ncbi:hypothetical protein [Haloarcula sp. H-GB5]